MIRSVLAVVAGIATLSVISFGLDLIVGEENKLLMSAYTLLSIAAGGYVTAWIAPRSPVRHAVIMGAIEAAMTVGVMFQMRDQFPLWGWIAGIVLIVPAAWLGARVCQKQRMWHSESNAVPSPPRP